MEKLIERYIYDVTRRLPEAQRTEVAKELRSDIDDMLANKTSDEDIKAVLTTLGNPRIVASNYRTHPRFLISPEMIDDYFRVLKIVLIIIGSISLVFGLIEHLMDHGATTFIGIFAEVLAETINDVVASLFRGFAIVTVIFALVDQYRDKVKRPAWTIKDLPDLPKENVAKISRTGSIVGLVFTVVGQAVWIYLLLNSNQYLGVFDGDNGFMMIAPLFTEAVILAYLPFFIVVAAFAVGMQLAKIFVGFWNPALAVGHTIYQVLSIVLFVLFVRQPNLLHPDLLLEIATFFEVSTDSIANGFLEGATGFAVFISIVTAIDIISTWVRTLKHEHIELKNLVDHVQEK